MGYHRLFLVTLICLPIALIGVPALAQSDIAGPFYQSNAMAETQKMPAERSPQLGGLAQKLQDAFRKIVTYDSGGAVADSVAVADLNGDGVPDVVLANACQGASKYLSCTNPAVEVGVLLGNRDGTFQPAVSYAAGGYSFPYASWSSVAIADVNGDGRPDLIVATQCQTAACTNSGVSILLGNGDGTFQPAVSYGSGGFGFDGEGGGGGQWVAVGDLRGDGKKDLIVVVPCQDENCTGGAISVLLGNGDGTFQPGVVYSTGASGTNSVAVADIDGDGKLDAVVVNGCLSGGCGDGLVVVFRGRGDGTLQSPVSYSTSVPVSTGLTIGDLNGDGKLDLVVGSDSFVWCWVQCGPVEAIVSLLLGNGDGTFQPAVTYGTAGFYATSVAIADMNGDGKADLVVAHQCPWNDSGDPCGELGVGQVAVLLSKGDGTFRNPLLYSTGGLNAEAVALADLDGDGRPDLVIANQCAVRGKGGCVSGGAVSVMLNNLTTQTATSVIGSPNPSQINQTVTFTATITSIAPVPDGEVVTFFSKKSELGTGTTVNGVAGLNASFAKAGTYSIKASYAGDVFHKGSSGTVQQVVTKGAETNPIGGGKTAAPANETAVLKPKPLDAGKKCGTSTYLSTSGSPSLITDTVTFTAQAIANDYCHGQQITCDDGGVNFYDDRVLIGMRPVQNCLAAWDTDSLTAGRHHIVATFVPGSGWRESSAKLTQVVNKWRVTVALSSDPNPSSHKQAVTFTGTAVSPGLTPTGQIKFRNGSRTIGSAILDANGMAVLTITKLPVGTDPITAEYLGDGYNSAGTSSILNQVVNP